MEPITPHAFLKPGAIEKRPDPMDIKLGAAGPKIYTFPRGLRNNDAWNTPIEYQSQQPACGAHSGAKLKGLALISRFTPRFTWADLKTFDGWPINDGTDIRSIFKSITKSGALDFAQLGNDVTLSLEEYAKAPTAGQRSLAIKNSGQGYGFITDLSFNGLKQFIFDNGPTILLVRVGAEWWTDKNGRGSWAEKDILPLRVPSPIVSGHFVVAHSYDENYIYFVNSFGSSWGRKGHGYFGPEYMPFLNDAGALFPLKFTKDLYFGMTDADVKKLQQYLNKKGYTIAPAGQPGSAGFETLYFGSSTRAALMKLQAAKGISPASGYFGPLTRAHVALNP